MRHCVRAAQRGDKIAAEELIKAFKPYLNHQAKKYQRFYQNFDEALSTAYHGAVDCIYQYDLSQFEETVTEVMVARYTITCVGSLTAGPATTSESKKRLWKTTH